MNSYSELLPVPTGGLEIGNSPSVTDKTTETPLKFSLTKIKY